jgi:hypothetical protein
MEKALVQLVYFEIWIATNALEMESFSPLQRSKHQVSENLTSMYLCKAVLGWRSSPISNAS